jgi:endogenous inhibitor of DNA gyrase (YacG/DUF329 family)
MIQYTCPTCQRTIAVAQRQDAPHRPFCSERCRLMDLGKWFNGEYVISDALPIEPEFEDDPPPAGA